MNCPVIVIVWPAQELGLYWGFGSYHTGHSVCGAHVWGAPPFCMFELRCSISTIWSELADPHWSLQ